MNMLFGQKSRLALECELEHPVDAFFNCSICLWADGMQIGDYRRGSSLRVSASVFRDTLKFVDELYDDELQSHSAAFVLDLIYGKLYAIPEEDVPVEDLQRDWQRYGKFIICPGSGPAFDGWMAVLLKASFGERFMWRYGLGTAFQVLLLADEYKEVVSSFLQWAEQTMG